MKLHQVVKEILDEVKLKMLTDARRRTDDRHPMITKAHIDHTGLS